MPWHVMVGIARIVLTWLLGLSAFLIPFGFYQRWLEREIVRQLCLIYMAGFSLDDYAVEQLRVMRPESIAVLKAMQQSGRPIAWTAGHVLSVLEASEEV